MQFKRQIDWVKHILVSNGSITRNYALRNYVSRLSALILKLKEQGYEFKTEYFTIQTPFGKSRDYRYILTKQPKKEQIK